MRAKRIINAYNALDDGRFKKAICGAAVEDEGEIERFVYTCALALFDAIDVRAGDNEIRAARRGRDRALSKSVTLDPIIIASVTPCGDVHSLKANIYKNRCSNCGACKESCPNDAISEEDGSIALNEPCCRGCGRCEEACPNNAISMKPMDNGSIEESVKNCIDAGADGVELHLSGYSEKEVEAVLDTINAILPQDILLSVCIGSMKSSPEEIISTSRSIAKKREGQKTVIQADGMTMGGRPGSFQGLATAEQVISAQGLGIYVIVSGAVTEVTWDMIEASGLEVAGIGVGIRLRELIREALLVDDIEKNNEIVQKAVSRAMNLHRPAHHKNNSGKIAKSFNMGPALKQASGWR